MEASVSSPVVFPPNWASLWGHLGGIFNANLATVMEAQTVMGFHVVCVEHTVPLMVAGGGRQRI